MIALVLVSWVLVCCSAVRAAPQVYGVLQVQEPPATAEQLGANDILVDLIIEILPEIGDVFEKITRARNSSSDPANFNFIADMFLSFLPFTEKIMRASAKAEGRDVKPEELERLARVYKVLPGYFRLFEDTAKKDFEGICDPAAVESGSCVAAPAASASPATRN